MSTQNQYPDPAEQHQVPVETQQEPQLSDEAYRSGAPLAGEPSDPAERQHNLDTLKSIPEHLRARAGHYVLVETNAQAVEALKVSGRAALEAEKRQG